jgi:hypothetical protein
MASTPTVVRSIICPFPPRFGVRSFIQILGDGDELFEGGLQVVGDFLGDDLRHGQVRRLKMPDQFGGGGGS